MVFCNVFILFLTVSNRGRNIENIKTIKVLKDL